MNPKPQSIFILSEDSFEKIYSPAAREIIAGRTDLLPERLDRGSWKERKDILAEVEFVFSGWGMAWMDEEFLAAAPRLRHVFYGAGSVRSFYTGAAIERGVTVSSAWRANAVPVAEYTLGAILLSLKKFWRIHRLVGASRRWERPVSVPGAYATTVGLVSLGAIGRMVAERLRTHDLRVIAHDPFADPAAAAALGVELVSLENVFSQADVVSLHTPNLPTTRGMINGPLLRSMKEGATLLNTSRGKVIDEPAMIEVLSERADLDAILDVTAEEPDNSDSPLWDLPNVILTPHIAGSMDLECRRMGDTMIGELENYLAGEPLAHEVTPELLKTMA